MPRPDALTAAVWPRSAPRPLDEAASSSSSSLASSSSSSLRCWKCRGHKFQYQKSTKHYDGAICKVCQGNGQRPRSKRALELAMQDGQILRLRGYPPHHPLRRRFPTGFAGNRTCTITNKIVPSLPLWFSIQICWCRRFLFLVLTLSNDYYSLWLFVSTLLFSWID